MSTIVQLDQNTINKIAAGEVIERPSAVVKELVENAIDAGANAITVEIKDGGQTLIRITDNGKGIANDDIKMAFLSHATSKIKSVEDLFMVKSLGFRGEALSSIAAVAQVELMTKTKEELTGTRYVIEGGHEKEMESIGCPNGTTFVIRNLFFNTPVRRKFLKTSHTEAGYVYDLLEKLAVSHSDISFKFINNGKVKLQTQGTGKLKDIIYSIYGREIYDNMLEANGERRNVSLTGYIGKPIISRGNREYENYYINGRYIKSSVIYKAIEEAYKPYSMVHRYPFVSLHLSIKPELIDVNVHPTKMEIRFANSHEVYEIVYTTIKMALENSKRIPSVELVEKKEAKTNFEKIPEPFEVNRRKEQELSKTQKQFDELNRKEEIKAQKTFEVDRKKEQEVKNNNQVKENNNSYSFIKAESDINIKEGFSREKYAKDVEKKDIEKDLLGIKNLKIVSDDDTINKKEDIFDVKRFETKEEIQKNETKEKVKEEIQKNETKEKIKEEIQKDETKEVIQKNDVNEEIVKSEQITMFEEIEQKKEIRIVGQVFRTYWIVEYDNKMFIIDQHAAHEKVMYERILKSYKEKKQHNSQMIVPNIVISLNMREESVLKKNMDIFKQTGFEIEHFGGKDYVINAVPADMYGITDKVLFTEMLDSLKEQDYDKTPEIIMEKIASMSCKAAVKGNNKLSALEAKELISEMMELDNPYNCPHGRPTIIELTKKELEKKFKRLL